MEKTSKTMMRVDKELLKEINKIKLVKGESYASVVKRLMDSERKKRNKAVEKIENLNKKKGKEEYWRF